MTSFVTNLKCSKCENEYPPTSLLYGCPKCGAFLEVQYDYEAMGDKISFEDVSKREPLIMQKWKEFLPIENETLIELATLGEATTPLVKSQRLGDQVGVKEFYIKNDSIFPTGSFKDRSMPMAIIKALELGAKTISLVSTGNAAASLAAHGARAGLEAIVLVDSEVPPSKLAQIMIYGAKIMVVKAVYSDIMKLFVAARDRFGWYDCNGEFNSFRFEGNKTYAYEICEQFHRQIPDTIISPMGSCTGISATWKGFRELLKMGWISQLPRLIGIQAEACSPVVKAFKEGKSETEPIVPKYTMATAIKVSNPPHGKKALQAIRESNGLAEAVSETEILEAVMLLAKNGFFVEPAGAVALAGARKLAEEGKIDKEEKVVCVVTGHGLKTPEIATNMWKKPPAIEPRLDELEKILES